MMYVLHTINSVQLGNFFLYDIGFSSLVSIVGIFVYYCSHLKFYNVMLLYIHSNVQKQGIPK